MFYDDDTARIATARIACAPLVGTTPPVVPAPRWPFVVVCLAAPLGFVAGYVGWHVMMAIMVISVLIK